jgi:hypothetical protein
MIPPSFASEAGLKVSPMARQLLDTMVPVIPTIISWEGGHRDSE